MVDRPTKRRKFDVRTVGKDMPDKPFTKEEIRAAKKAKSLFGDLFKKKKKVRPFTGGK